MSVIAGPLRAPPTRSGCSGATGQMRHSGHLGEEGVQGLAASSTVATGAGGGMNMAPMMRVRPVLPQEMAT